MTASVTTYPLDFARTRLAGVTGRDIGLVGILREAVQDGGYRSLYRGCGPTILGAMPYEGIKFGMYGFLSNYYGEKNNRSRSVIFSNVLRGTRWDDSGAGCVPERHGEKDYANFRLRR